jgi:hypothetical protein
VLRIAGSQGPLWALIVLAALGLLGIAVGALVGDYSGGVLVGIAMVAVAVGGYRKLRKARV